MRNLRIHRSRVTIIERFQCRRITRRDALGQSLVRFFITCVIAVIYVPGDWTLTPSTPYPNAGRIGILPPIATSAQCPHIDLPDT